jgi:hypothetical protein
VVGWWSLTRYLPTAPARISAIKQQSAESQPVFIELVCSSEACDTYFP